MSDLITVYKATYLDGFDIRSRTVQYSEGAIIRAADFGGYDPAEKGQCAKGLHFHSTLDAALGHSGFGAPATEPGAFGRALWECHVRESNVLWSSALAS